MIRFPSFLFIPLLTGFAAWACVDFRGEHSGEPIPVGVTVFNLESPSLIGPNTGRFIWSGNTVLMRWRTVIGADSYQLDLSRDSTFSTKNTETTILDTTSFRSKPLVAGTYYWHVRARIGTQARSHWSDRRSFWLRDRD